MWLFKKKALTEDAQYVKEIIENYSKKDHIKKMVSPLSDEYFLIDEEHEVYVCIGYDKVTLSNHKFLYKKFFPFHFIEVLQKIVKENMESEMQELKKSLFKDETDLLCLLLKIATENEKSNIISPNFKEKNSS